MTFYAHDPSRHFISLSGQDAPAFLQGLITNDIHKVTPTTSIYTALLTPQGKYLFDFFICWLDGGFLIDIDQSRHADLMSLLRKYKLRSDVQITDASNDYQTTCIFGPDAGSVFDMEFSPGKAIETENQIVVVDPRLADLGLRLAGRSSYANEKLTQTNMDDYDAMRLQLGIPKGGDDMIIDKAIPLECGLDDLNAISWDKGCYLGQELTARTKHRGLVRKRLLPFTFAGEYLEPLTPVTLNGEEVGSTRTAKNGQGIARIRLDALGVQNQMDAGGLTIQVSVLPWMNFQS